MVNKHDKNLDDLLNRQVFELIEHPMVVIKEAAFYSGRNKVAEPDGLVWNGEYLTIIEYKSSPHQEKHAVNQLRNAHQFIRGELGLYVPTERVVVVGNGHVINLG